MHQPKKTVDNRSPSKDAPAMNDLMSIREVISYLHVSYYTVRAMIDRGDLTPVPWSSRYVKFRRSEVDRIKRGEHANG